MSGGPGGAANGQHKTPIAARVDPFFRIRLINIDHVLTFPSPIDRTVCAFNAEGYQLRKVPVLRVFGATPAGQRVCLHIHNVYPYCYIPYKGSLEPENVLRYIHRLGRELNTAIAVSLRRNPEDPESSQYIAAIHLCKGINFYGYHVGHSYFFKISFVDPSHNYRLATILESGGVMRTRFQAFELHIRYQLQFMLDYNIFGCDYIDLDDVRFRLPVPDGETIAADGASPLSFRDKLWNRNSIPYTNLHGEDVHRETHCAIEADASAPWIINRRNLKPRDLHRDFNEDQMVSFDDNKLVPSLRGLWEDEKIRRASVGLPASIPAEDTSRDPRVYATGESPKWMSEDRMRLLLQKRLEDEKKHTLERERQQSHFTNRSELDQYIMSTFEAVECFHPYQDQIRADDPYTQRSGPSASAKIFDLKHSMTQGESGPSQFTQSGDIQLGTAEEKEFDSLNTDMFKSQDFAAKLLQAEAVALAEENPLIDGDHDEEAPSAYEEPGERQSAWRRNDSTSSAASSTGSIFAKSPSSTPKKNRVIDLSHPDQTIASSPGSKQSDDAHREVMQTWNDSKGRLRRLDSHSESSQKSTEIPRKGRVRFASDPSSSPKTNYSSDRTAVAACQTNASRKRRVFAFHEAAPSQRSVTETFSLFSVVRQVHVDPYFSHPLDVPERLREYAGRMFKFQSDSLSYLKPFLHWHTSSSQPKPSHLVPAKRHWQFGPPPPTLLDARTWQQKETLVEERRSKRRRARMLSQIERLTQANDFGFKRSQHQPTSLVTREKQHMTTLSLEVLCCTRGTHFPDPAKDAIEAILYCYQNEDEHLQDTGSRADLRTGLIVVNRPGVDVTRLGLSHLAIETVETELDLFNALIDLMRAFDPEILAGWEIHSSSWGLVIERASTEYDFDLVSQLGRSVVHNTGRAGGKSDNYAYTQSSALRITGRHVLNLWRLMKGELALNVYTLENVCYHLLHKRIPKFSFEILTTWYNSGRPELIRRALLYYIDTAELILEIISESEFVFRTAEFARIYGIDFFSVISRGSQFKVESIMLRIAKPENFVLITPNRSQVGQQNAAECLPLIMEPQSAFYKGPLVVLDFQSLYPSIMIAHNLCYSTCLGRVAGFKGTPKFGVTEYGPPKGLLSLLQDDVNISSNGLLFVKPHVRKSLLAKMLAEILDTRVMIKSSMKGTKTDKAFQRIQGARQLSLKLLANVTYGYTSASFSGRMPCVEIADAIVQTGRETLEKAMNLINGTEKWGAQVVYGDTDSLFIYLPGRTKEEAFKLGNEIADTVTSQNPRPVKLKFEKVYLPSVLLAKKRYVGFKFETLDDREPGFDAKGIETVRRDFHPTIQRMLEACIRILFRSRDLSAVKSYLLRQWRKILEGRVSPQDFIFAKEVKLGSYSDKVAPPPGAAVASRRMLMDLRAEPQYGERVPYIISQGAPQAKLNQQAVSPAAFIKNPQLQINALYYIRRTIIPPLARVFNLLGADVESWFNEMPKPSNVSWHKRPSTTAHLSATLDMLDADSDATRSAAAVAIATVSNLNSHYATDTCLLCGSRTESSVCIDCRQSPDSSMHSIGSKLHLLQRTKLALDRTCSTCSGHEVPVDESGCISLDCPYTYQKAKVGKDLEDADLTFRYFSHLVGGDVNHSAQTQNAWKSVLPETDSE